MNNGVLASLVIALKQLEKNDRIALHLYCCYDCCDIAENFKGDLSSDALTILDNYTLVEIKLAFNRFYFLLNEEL